MKKAEENKKFEGNTSKIEFSDKLLMQLSLAKSEIEILALFGFTRTLSLLFEISKMIESEGRHRVAGKLNNYTFDAYYNLMEAEFFGRTSAYFVMGCANQLPIEIINAYTKARLGLEKLEESLHYPEEELITDKLKQNQLVHLFSALSYAEVFTKSPNLLAESLAMISPYEIKSIKRVINLNNSTKGGHSEDTKKALINELTKIINDF